MAPLVEPKSLQKLSITAVSLAVDSACTDIFLEHGCYGNEECTIEIARLQERLISALPSTVFEQLVEERNSHNGVCSQLLWSKDPRIKLAVFLHPSISRFNVDAKGNELLRHSACHQSGDQDGGLDEFFWCAQIRRLSNLVALNLNLITTDEILRVIGESCPQLEVVNVNSRITQEHRFTPGITLKFYVSDAGLRCLIKCRRLRRITMNKNIQHTNANDGISLDGVRALVNGLPRLEYISFGSIGRVLDCFTAVEDSAPLKLTYFSEQDPAYVDVPRLSRLCPDISAISLSVPYSINDAGEVSTNVRHCDSILDALAASELSLRVVELQHFPFDDSFRSFLRSKGGGIQELLFRGDGPLNSTHVAFIGEHCPTLQRLHLKEVCAEEERSFSAYESLKRKYFQKLLHLHLSGRLWSPTVIVPMVLSGAADVRQISLFRETKETQETMDAVMLRLLHHNKLKQVRSINLYDGCFISMPVVRQLTFCCPALTAFSFLQFEGIEIAEVERLKAELATKNLDIKVHCLETLDL